MLTLTQAQRAIVLQQQNSSVTVADLEQLLANVSGTTFAGIEYVTRVATAAAHKATTIYKYTVANVQLFNNLQAATNAYTNAVKRTASKLGDSTTENIEAFVAASNYFEHTACYSIVKHKAQNKFYLFAIYNKAESLYVINDKIATKQEVAQYLTPSAAEKLLQPSNITHNVSQDVTHNVIVRTIALQSIVKVTAQQQTVTI